MDTSLYQPRRISFVLGGAILLLVVLSPRIAHAAQLLLYGVQHHGEVVAERPTFYVVRTNSGQNFEIPKISVLDFVFGWKSGQRVSFVALPNYPRSARKSPVPLATVAIFTVAVTAVAIIGYAYVAARGRTRQSAV